MNVPIIQNGMSLDKAFYKIFKLKDLLRYWIIADGKTTVVDIAVKDCKKFNQAILSMLDAQKTYKEE